MKFRAAAVCVLYCILLLSLAACAPAIETDESDWEEAITLGSTESTSSTTEGSSTAGTSESTVSTTGSTSASTAATSSSATGTTTTTKTTTTTTAGTTTSRTTGATANADISVGYVNATTLNVRPEPNTVCEPIGGLKQGDQVSIIGRSGDWYVIRFGDTEAYVSAQYISATPVE